MNRILRFLAPLLLLEACMLESRTPPERSSAPLVRADVQRLPGVPDKMRTDLVWYDNDEDKVMRLEGGVPVPVQARPIRRAAQGAPKAVRVFDDGSMLVLTERLWAFPSEDAEPIPIATPMQAIFDGVSVDDFWTGGYAGYGNVFPGTDITRGVCHVVHFKLDGCIDIPNPYGYEEQLAVGADGSVYMSDGERGLYRYDPSTDVQTRLSIRGDSLQRKGANVLVLNEEGAFVLEGDAARRVPAQRLDFVGTPDDFWYVTEVSRQAPTNPDCRDALLSRCPRSVVWTQRIVWHSVRGQAVEMGHDTCTEAREPACSPFLALGVDGDHAALLLKNGVVRTQ